MFIGKINLIQLHSTLSATGITRQEIKYNILNILSRANKVLVLDDININKRNPNNNINADNLKQIQPVSSDFTMYESYFDFIFVGSWDNPIISTNKATYFGICEGTNLPSSLKDDNNYNIIKMYSNTNLIFLSTLKTMKVGEYYALLEQDLRDYNINKIINL